MEIVEELFDFVLRVFCCSRLFGGDATEGNEGGDVDRAGVVKNSTNDLLEATNASEGEDGEFIMGNWCLCISTKMARWCFMWTVLWTLWGWVFKPREKFCDVIRHADVLSWKCHRHVVTCRPVVSGVAQFWPDGPVAPTQN